MPPVLPPPPASQHLPNLRHTFGIAESREDLRPPTTSNFSRPYQSRAMSTTASPPIGTANGQSPPRGDPRRIRRRKDPTPFNVLVVGAKNAGKTSFIDFIRTSFPHSGHSSPNTSRSDGSFMSHYLETEIDGERVGLTMWDSQGLERNIVDLQLKEMNTFIESKFEETFAEEQKVQRSPGVRDTHIHCVFLVLDPLRLDLNLRAEKETDYTHSNAFALGHSTAGLDNELDLQVMKAFSGKTTVIPVISKADTLTAAHMTHLKKNVWDAVQQHKLDPLDALDLDESGDEFEPDSEDQEFSDSEMFPIQHPKRGSAAVSDDSNDQYDSSDLSDGHVANTSSPRATVASSVTTASPVQPFKRPHSRSASRTMNTADSSVDDIYIPFTVITPDPYDPNTVGRRFPWGVADPYNPEHCDFVRLKDSVFGEWRSELRSAAREKWYENWRTSRLKRTPQKVRQVGGVTPVASIPREGRTISGSSNSSPIAIRPSLHATASASERPRTASKAERTMGIQASPVAF
ncbi:hypothetical protein MBLNU457_4782t1 [Dothideomycetes sp. NU457]